MSGMPGWESLAIFYNMSGMLDSGIAIRVDPPSATKNQVEYPISSIVAGSALIL